MPITRFNYWDAQGRAPLTRAQRLVTDEVGATNVERHEVEEDANSAQK